MFSLGFKVGDKVEFKKNGVEAVVLDVQFDAVFLEYVPLYHGEPSPRGKTQSWIMKKLVRKVE